MVIRKQGFGDESEIGEGRQGKTRKDLEMGVHWREGKIHRSVGVQCSGVLGEEWKMQE